MPQRRGEAVDDGAIVRRGDVQAAVLARRAQGGDFGEQIDHVVALVQPLDRFQAHREVVLDARLAQTLHGDQLVGGLVEQGVGSETQPQQADQDKGNDAGDQIKQEQLAPDRGVGDAHRVSPI
jgi:hypothetical protein